MDGRQQPADRVSLGRGRCRQDAQTGGATGNARARRHLRFRRPRPGAVAPPVPVPMLLPIVPDPLVSGFVESLSRPGGNVTGFMMFEYNLSGKWLGLLKEIAPDVTRAAVLRDPAIAAGTGQFAVIQSVAPSRGVEVIPVNMRDAA